MKSEARKTPVPMLVDKSPEDYQEIIHAASNLIEAAKDDKLVSVVCKHNETGEEQAILCIIYSDEEAGTCSYTPVGKLYHGIDLEFTEFTPPTAMMIADDS